MVLYTKDSVSIREFIKQNILPISVPPINLSKKSRAFVEKIHNLSVMAFNASSNSFFKLISPGVFSKDFEKSSNYSYICKEIRNGFEPQNKFKKTIEMRVGNRVIKVRFVLPVQNNATDTRQYSDAVDIYARRIYVYLYIVDTFACNDCSKEIDIFLYLTNSKKMLPSVSGDAIDRIHVNTAFTTSCEPKTEIILFRKEEWFKVLMHETFHCLGLDFSEHSSINSEVHSEILKHIPIKSEVKLYETYCEMWAEIINTIIITTIENHGKTISFPSLVEDMLHNELFYSLFQVAKILNHFNLDYEDLYKDANSSGFDVFSFGGGAANKKRNRYKEQTEIFSYFLLKTILLFNCDTFIQWVLQNNNNGIMFKNPEINVKKFSQELILAKYKNPELVSILSKINKTFFTKKHSKRDDYIFENMRMTANEIV
jgi:hypothetical protein